METKARRSRLKAIYIGSGFVILLLGIALATASRPRIRQGLVIVALKADGSLPSITWLQLYRMLKPGRPHFNMGELAKFSQTPDPYRDIENAYATHSDVSAGARIFAAHCAVCHGSDGAGGNGGPSLQHRQMVRGSSDWALFRTITYGVPGTGMPANNLPWLAKWRLVAYVKSLMLHGANVHNAGLEPAAHIGQPVTYQDILAPKEHPNEWLTYSGAYDSQRFSQLRQITPVNIDKLHVLWMRQYNTTHWMETTPLVVGGYMFVTIPPARVQALDAKTGRLIWSYTRNLPPHLSVCCSFVNRGLAVLGDALYLGTLDAHLVALDIRTGKVLWDAKIANYRDGYTITGAPLALKGMVVTGVAGGEFGVRGFVEARDATSGKKLWKFYTIPGLQKAGSNTWSDDSSRTGGAPTWMTGSFDPQANLIYWPTGNPSPDYQGGGRKGANLYSDSILALNADQGTLHWFFQFTPHDVWDWDATEAPILFDKDIAGKEHHYLAQANRNGFYYLLNRDTGRFILARPFARETWAKRIGKNGRPVINPEALPTRRGTNVYPNGGATNWWSPSYSPLTGFIYVPVWEVQGEFYSTHPEFHPGENFRGGFFEAFAGAHPKGAVLALNALTAKQEWQYSNPAYNAGGLLSTAGGILFGSQQGNFFALDAKTGRELWHFRTGGGILAAPITFMCDGEQMVTIAAGHDVLTFGP